MPMSDAEDFAAARFEKSHQLVFAAPVDRVFEMFTPEGERRWVEGWNPQYWPRDRRELVRGTVFTTDAGGEYTLWIVARIDTDRHEVEYARTVPGSRAGLVRVRCSGRDGGAATEVEVTYTLAALSEAGNAALETLADGAYAAMMRHWEADVARALEGG